MKYIIEIPTAIYKNIRFYGLHLNPRDVKELEKALIQAEVFKTGKWTKIEYAEEVNGYLIPNYECSQCGYWSRENYDYCPNCGARMLVE